MFHHAVEKISTHVLLQNRPGTHVSIVDTASARLKFIIDEDGLIPAKKDGNFHDMRGRRDFWILINVCGCCCCGFS